MFGSDSGFIQVADRLGRTPVGGFEEDSESKRPEVARPRILVVDDERLIAETMAEILEDAGFHARIAYDGWTALEIATEFRPDYLLTDVLMPRMNGVELAIAIRKILPAARVLLFSGQAGISEIVLRGQEQGYEFELIAKPIHPEKLIARLRDEKT
jgi:DNA-binding response OmpR family regulator